MYAKTYHPTMAKRIKFPFSIFDKKEDDGDDKKESFKFQGNK